MHRTREGDTTSRVQVSGAKLRARSIRALTEPLQRAIKPDPVPTPCADGRKPKKNYRRVVLAHPDGGSRALRGETASGTACTKARPGTEAVTRWPERALLADANLRRTLLELEEPP